MNLLRIIWSRFRSLGKLRARKRFGNFQRLREECRDVRGASVGEGTLKDLSLELSMLRKNGMRLVFLGMLLGLAGSAALSYVLRRVLYGLSPLDPISFFGVSLFLTLAALLACYVPARCATKVEPMIALRCE